MTKVLGLLLVCSVCKEAVAAEGLGYEVVYDFTPYPEGRGPNSLIQASDGSFYGTTSLGGTHEDGTIFKLDSQGVLTILQRPICGRRSRKKRARQGASRSPLYR